MSRRLPPPARIRFRPDGSLVAPDFDDTYFSADGGLAETRTVFLAGCGLPDRWAGHDLFTVAELGLGTGLNLLATWDLWRQSRRAGAVLHYVAVEGFLLDAADAARVRAAAAPDLTALSDRLTALWPVRTAGLQRIWLDDDGLALTMAIGPAAGLLPALGLSADAWFLDGFAPSRNPDLWSPDVLGAVARLSAPGARAATYSVAGSVRRGLAAAGFEVRRAPGFGRKRERLEAVLPGPPAPVRPRVRSALVIGGGVAGAAAARSLLRRGLQVTLLDADPDGRTKASGNPRAVVMPRLDRDATREGRFHRAAFVLAARELARLGPTLFEPVGVIETARSPRDRDRACSLLDDPPLPPDWLADDGAGRMVHLAGGIVSPVETVRALLAGARVLPVAAAGLRWQQGRWEALDGGGGVLAGGDLCVVAAGPQTSRLVSTVAGTAALPLEGRHGTVSVARMNPDGGLLPGRPLAGGAYAGRIGPDGLFFGATFDPWPLTEPPAPVTQGEHLRNRALLARVAPELAQAIDPAAASGRSSVRTTTPDRMPVAGPVGSQPGLAVLTGLGARGFTTAFLCAELVAARLLGEPLPVEQDLAGALAPERFALRAARRGKGEETSGC